MLKGFVHRYGDDVDTDVIIPARYLTSSDPEVLKEHCMEDIDQEFAKKVKPGDFIVAGSNFGCGSSREHAPLSIKAAGVSAVIAKSFARIFFRNSFNIGLPIIESAEAAEAVESGDELEIDLETGAIKNLTKGTEYKARPVPEFMRELIADGGLIEHTKRLVAEGLLEPEPEPEKKTAKKKKEKPKEPGDRQRELEAEAEASSAGRDAPWVEDPEEKPKDPDADDDDDDDDDDDAE